jgi:predicted glycogen debranching enzyme
LFLETGRHDEGRRLLTDYGARLSEGMLANTADTGTLEYNTVDATLWFAHAIDRHVTRTGDDDLAAAAAPWLRHVIEAHLAGTRYGIRADADGLLTQGQDHMALTWMDARLGDYTVTPRIGKPVEVNALWINALSVAGALHQRLGLPHEDIDRAQARARSAFAVRFRPAAGGAVADVVDGPEGDDPSVRPNQIIAASLPHGPTVDVRWLGPSGGLLTPLGLRTLDPSDPRYRGAHAGDVRTRDEAYHQGTTWPWLIGPLASAADKLGLDPGPLLDGLAAHLGEWGVGSISETAHGDPPHTASGTPFQAWSVAEALRAHRLLTDRPRQPSTTDPLAGA